MSGFALEEYTVPKFGSWKQVVGGTMPKDAGENSSQLGQIRKIASKVPGPGHFDISHMDQKSWASKGGHFVKSAKDAGWKANKVPPVGQYHVAEAVGYTKKRTMGGKLPQAARGCHFWDTAAARSSVTPAPGKYEPHGQPQHLQVPNFTKTKTESRSTKKPAHPGPGQYDVNHSLTEERIPNYGTDKQAPKTFIDRIKADKAKLPAPGHCGIPDSKVVNTKGVQKHANGLLHSRAIACSSDM